MDTSIRIYGFLMVVKFSLVICLIIGKSKLIAYRSLLGDGHKFLNARIF